MSVTVNLENNLWSIYSNQITYGQGQFFTLPGLSGTFRMNNNKYQFSLRDDSDFSNIPGCAVDNIQVIGVPEPATLFLLGLGAAISRKFKK